MPRTFAVKIYLVGRDLKQLGDANPRRVLLSFYYFESEKLRDIKSNYLGSNADIFIDSGGFTARSKNVEIDIFKYIRWIKQNSGDMTVYANLDVIGNQVETRKNQEIMESNDLSPLPVFHIGSTFRELRRLCDQYSFIAIGGLVPHMKSLKNSSIFRFLDRLFEIAGDKKLHGFGCINLKILFNYPWFSVDTRAWLTGVLYREVPIFDEYENTIKRIHWKDHKSLRRYRRKIESMGYDWRDIAKFDRVTVLRVSRSTFDEVESYLTDKWGRG